MENPRQRGCRQLFAPDARSCAGISALEAASLAPPARMRTMGLEASFGAAREDTDRPVGDVGVRYEGDGAVRIDRQIGCGRNPGAVPECVEALEARVKGGLP